MTFVVAIAGPSRITRSSTCNTLKAIATRQASSASTATRTTEDAQDDADLKRAKAQEKAFWQGEKGYRDWLSKVGSQYRYVNKGQRARWLGGSISNPSFRPPPPLSNDLQDVLSAAIKRGASTAQIAHQFNISKARIEAVKKLKEVEAEFLRQGLPVQRAFLEGMEPLLGVRPLRNPQTNTIEPGLEREEAARREADQSTGIERLEEERYEGGIGQGGVFADRVSAERAEGIERTIWEFRTEESEVGEKMSQEGKTQPIAKDLASELQTPQTAKITADIQTHTNREESPSKVKVQSSRVAYRFVDISAKKLK